MHCLRSVKGVKGQGGLLVDHRFPLIDMNPLSQSGI